MSELFESFPYIKSDMLIIRKMTEEDVDALNEITGNDYVYRYIPPFLYKKSRSNLLAAIRNLGSTEFAKEHIICAGIYLCTEPDRLVGFVEMFDYKIRESQMTIGYCLNEKYWHRGIATEATRLMVNYLCNDMGVKSLKAYVAFDNEYSKRVLLKNGFIEKNVSIQGKIRAGKEISDLREFAYTAR